MADDYIYKLNPGKGWMFKGGPRSSPVAPFTGVYKGDTSLNMGWKIHFDLKSTLSLQDSLKEAGMDASQNIIDSSKFKSVAQRYLSYSGGSLSDKEVAQGIYDIINFGRRQLPGGMEYEQLFPKITDIFDTADVLKSQGMDFKFGPNTYGNWTAYPSSLERRDKLIASLESSIGSRLEEAKNIESSGSDLLSRYTKGRFTSQYMKQIPEFMKQSWSAVLSDDEFQKLPPLQRIQERIFSSAKNFPDTLKKFLASEPILEELMFGPKGYVSPYEDIPSLLKARGISIDIPGRTAITPITPHATTVTPSNIPNTPQLKQSPEPIIKITPHAQPVMNIPGHGQVIDPIEIATRRAQRQADLDEVFNPIQINQRVNAQRKAALPGKKLNKAQRRAAKNARALEVQKQREDGSKLARAEAERIKAERAAQQVVQPKTVSSSGATKTQSTVKSGRRVVRSEPIYINPVTRQREGRPEFVGNRKGRLKVGQTREGSIDTRRIAGFEVSINGVPVRSDLYMPTIDAPTYEAYGSISDGSPKKIGMSQEEAIDYISKRVDIDGGTLARNKSLPGFGQGVKDIVDQGILSKEEVSKIVQSKNILELTHSTSLSQYFRPTNAGQVADALDLEELYRLSYGQALSASQQGVGMGKGEQIRIGRAIGLGEKQGMMVDHENLVKGYNAALKDLYDADRAQKIAAHAKNRQDLKDLFNADKQQKLAAHAKNRQDLIDLKEADKQQKLAADAANKERLATERRIQAVLTADVKPQNEYKIYQQLDEAAERAIETTNKAPIAKRTVEKLMESHTLAAGVAAGGLGLIYAANRLRAERQVGRE